MKRVKEFWCYKVLPLVYDSSLSYLEVLQKLITKINEVITTTGEMAANVVEAFKNSEAAINTANEAEDKAQEALNKANNIPTKTSDLVNDSGFVNSTAASAAAPVQSVNSQTGNVLLSIPTKTSELNNDSGFITIADVPTKTSELTNDSGFITSSDVPTKTSELTNDSGFITSSDIPTKTSELNNDSGFITIADVPTKISDLQNDVINNISQTPSNVSVPSGTYTNLGGVTLPYTGIYILSATIRFTANNTGYRRLMFSTNSAVSSSTAPALYTTSLDVFQNPLEASQFTSMRLSYPVSDAANTKVYLWAYQNSGSTLTASAINIRATRLK